MQNHSTSSSTQPQRLGTRDRLDESTLRRLCEVEHIPLADIASDFGYLGDASGVYYLCRKWGITPYRTPRPTDHLRTLPLSPHQHQVVLGTLLGDSYIFVHGNRVNQGACLSMVQGEGQLDYLNWKKKQLEPFITATDATRYAQHGYGEGRYRYSYKSVAHPAFTEYRALFYPDGIKRLTQPLLDRLGPLALAVWIMDDGSYHATRHYITICTNAHTKDELSLAAEWFHGYLGHAPYIHSAGRANQFHLAFNRVAAEALRDMVRPYFFPPLLYKIGFVWWPDEEPPHEPVYLSITELRRVPGERASSDSTQLT